jgi:hypothetical protein
MALIDGKFQFNMDHLSVRSCELEPAFIKNKYLYKTNEIWIPHIIAQQTHCHILKRIHLNCFFLIFEYDQETNSNRDSKSSRQCS